MSIETTRQDIGAIQMLRGVAALMVVFVHLDVELARLGYGAIHAGKLAFGVDIFFVISGFIMWVSTERRPGLGAGQFMWNRIVRIVPLYWLLTMALLVVALIAPTLLHTTVFDPVHVLTSFFFVPSRHPTTGDFWPFLIPGWSLNFEMFFYVLFALSIFGSGGSASRRLLLVSGLMIGAFIVANLFKDRIDTLNFYANPIVLEFLAGILVGILYCRGSVSRSWAWSALVPLGFVVAFAGDAWLPLNLLACLAAMAIVAGAVFAPWKDIAGLNMLGDASYALYLTHVLTLGVVEGAWRAAGLRPAGPIAFGIVAVAAALLVAFATHFLVEKPLTRQLRNRPRAHPELQKREA